MKTIDISPINHSEIGVINAPSERYGLTTCTIHGDDPPSRKTHGLLGICFFKDMMKCRLIWLEAIKL